MHGLGAGRYITMCGCCNKNCVFMYCHSTKNYHCCGCGWDNNGQGHFTMNPHPPLELMR